MAGHESPDVKRFSRLEDALASLDQEQPAGEPRALVESRLQALEDRLRELPADATRERVSLELEAIAALVELDRLADASERARAVVDAAIGVDAFARAAEACRFIYMLGLRPEERPAGAPPAEVDRHQLVAPRLQDAGAGPLHDPREAGREESLNARQEAPSRLPSQLPVREVCGENKLRFYERE